MKLIGLWICPLFKRNTDGYLSMLEMIESDPNGFAEKVLSRKGKYIINGYSELDFPYPEIEETFLAIEGNVKKKLNEIEVLKAELKRSNLIESYKVIKLLIYDKLEREYKQIEQNIKNLRAGKKVQVSTIERGTRAKEVLYPYGDSIRVCESYTRTTDFYVRAVKRFERFGPHKPYFKEALKLTGMQRTPKNVSEYVKLLEQQDYITAYEKLLAVYKNDENKQDVYRDLLKGKSNGYIFPQRTPVLKAVLQEMAIPPNFQTPRYGNHLEEDLLALDIVLFPSMNPVDMDFFNNTRDAPVFILGVSELIYADEFDLTSGDFLHHDAKHTLDMVSRNWTALREQGRSFQEMRELFEKNKQQIHKQYLGLLKIDDKKIPVDKHLLDKFIGKLKALGIITDKLMINEKCNLENDVHAQKSFRDALTEEKATPEEIEILYSYMLNQLRLKEAMRLVIFELVHEEGYPYDWNAMIRGLTEKNMFYGETIKDFLIKKIVNIHFFTSKSDPQLASNEVVKKIPEANDILVGWCEKFRQLAVNDGYRSDANLDVRYDMLRGPKQINPYQQLKRETQYQTTQEKIGNIYLQKALKSETDENTPKSNMDSSSPQRVSVSKRAPLYMSKRIENEDLRFEKDSLTRNFEALDLQSSTREPPTMILTSQGISPPTEHQKRLLASVNYTLLTSGENTQYRRPLFERLINETKIHKNYLTEIGLGERAKGINIIRFIQNDENLDNLDLQSFSKRPAIPQEVLNFDPSKKNTIITTDPNVAHNKPEDLKKILDIRLYPVLRDMIKRNKLEVFLGTKNEMAAYYKSKRSEILFQFMIPSSATYYLVETAERGLFVVMANLVSNENIIAQLLTLKLAGIKPEDVEIIGETAHFSEMVKVDIANLLKKMPELTVGTHALVVAGCGLENMVSDIIDKELNNRIGKAKTFKGDIISLNYTPLLHPENDVHGFISVHLNYGEITEYIIKLFLENCHCKQVFTGSAGGYIPRPEDSKKPAIGTRMAIISSMNENGEIATVNEKLHSDNDASSRVHLQIPSIFLETFEWLKHARERGASVDVETFYIIRAIQDYNKRNPSAPVKADCGYFVSDYVGEQPLREYSKVFQHYPEVLSKFLDATLTSKNKARYSQSP